MVHAAALKALGIAIYFSRIAQVAFLEANKALTEIFFKYLDYANNFSTNLAIELLEHNVMNDYGIKLVKSKQSLYGRIYSLSLVELKTLKTYIKIHLKIGFIQPTKFPARALIIYDQKSNRIFCLHVDYQGLNNLNIKNQYLFFLIGEFLD